MDNNIVKKKIKLILISVLTLLTVLSSTIVIFVSEKQNYVILQTSKQNVANSEGNENSNKIDNPELNARIALIYDRASGRIIYEKNGNKQTPMASTTKILTSIVILENADLKETVTIGSKAAGTGGSRLGLKKNDKITVNDLLYGLMLRSGNDAAVALALHVGGSIEGFADMMNKKAEELGLTNSQFVVPHGLGN